MAKLSYPGRIPVRAVPQKSQHPSASEHAGDLWDGTTGVHPMPSGTNKHRIYARVLEREGLCASVHDLSLRNVSYDEGPHAWVGFYRDYAFNCSNQLARRGSRTGPQIESHPALGGKKPVESRLWQSRSVAVVVLGHPAEGGSPNGVRDDTGRSARLLVGPLLQTVIFQFFSLLLTQVPEMRTA